MVESKPKEEPIGDSNGFTLIEIIAVLTIIGILGSITIKKVLAVEETAIKQSFTWVISELNTREASTWSFIKISDTNWLDDTQLYAAADYDLGDYSWSSRTVSGGVLNFRGQQIELDRAPSTSSAPGRWKMK